MVPKRVFKTTFTHKRSRRLHMKFQFNAVSFCLFAACSVVRFFLIFKARQCQIAAATTKIGLWIKRKKNTRHLTGKRAIWSLSLEGCERFQGFAVAVLTWLTSFTSSVAYCYTPSSIASSPLLLYVQSSALCWVLWSCHRHVTLFLLKTSLGFKRSDCLISCPTDYSETAL